MIIDLLKDYFFLNLNYYFKGFDFQINIFLLALSLGIAIASILVTVYKRNLSNIVRQLTRHGADSEANAKTLADLKIKPGFTVKSSLSKRGQLSAIVGMVGGFPFEKKTEGKKEEKIDFSTASFYIKNSDRAARINEEKFPSYVNAILAAVLIIMITVIITLLMPEILTFITGIE